MTPSIAGPRESFHIIFHFLFMPALEIGVILPGLQLRISSSKKPQFTRPGEVEREVELKTLPMLCLQGTGPGDLWGWVGALSTGLPVPCSEAYASCSARARLQTHTGPFISSHH